MTTSTKKIAFVCLLMAMAQFAKAQVKIGENPAVINKGSILELESEYKGLLFPRVGLTSTTTWGLATGSVSTAGMVVYNTRTIAEGFTGTAAYPSTLPNGTGLYYWDGTGWVGSKGLKGEPGASGAIGPKGDAGVVGVAGLPGRGGTPGTPGSGTPGAPGAGITIVTNDSGTWVYNPTTNTWTNINGPKGDKGDAGVVGVEGQPGTGGTPGTPGSGTPGAPGTGITIVTNDSGTWVYNPTTNTWTNINGPKGDKGDPGIVGLPGTSGIPGTPGSGTPGAPGAGVTIVNNDSGTWVYNPTTNTWTNVVGPKGDTGTPGATGLQGPKGDTGTPGGTGLQGPKGDTGTPGATGLQGPKGDTGTPGATGLQGPKGDTGTPGATGLQGPKGDTGTPGATGLQGPKGDTGTPGVTGLQGPKGDTGTPGIQGPKGDTGTFIATANNGLTLTGTNMQLGGDLVKATTITNNGQSLTIASGGSNVVITGLPAGATTDQLVVADANGILKQIKAAMPKWFFMPSIVLDTRNIGQEYTVNLYVQYKAQFENIAAIKRNPSSQQSIPFIPSAAELDYYVTYFDSDVIELLSVADNGDMKYKVKARATVTSFANIVFVIK